MSIIGVPNLKDRNTKGNLNIFVNLCKEEKCEKIWQFSGTNMLRNTKAISFNF